MILSLVVVSSISFFLGNRENGRIFIYQSTKVQKNIIIYHLGTPSSSSSPSHHIVLVFFFLMNNKTQDVLPFFSFFRFQLFNFCTVIVNTRCKPKKFVSTFYLVIAAISLTDWLNERDGIMLWGKIMMMIRKKGKIVDNNSSFSSSTS